MSTFDSILGFMNRGGFVMWPLLVLSILTISVVIERAVFWWRIDSRRGRARYQRLVEAVGTADATRVAALAESDDSPFASLARRLPLTSAGLDESAAAVAAEEERPRIERGSLLLSTIVTAAPMLGILGTVVGIIQAFELLGGDATITDPNEVSGGIAEALISTACGLVVALVALFPYMTFRGRSERALGRLEAFAGAVVAASRRRRTS